jgi:hypothetical protein
MAKLHLVSRSGVAIGGLAVIAALLGQPAVAGASATPIPSARSASADVGTVTVTANAVGMLPVEIGLFSFDNVLVKFCMSAASCSFDVPTGTRMVVRYKTTAPFSLSCPGGSNVDGPGLQDGYWMGWCGSHDISTINATENMTATATATTNAPVVAYGDTLPTWTLGTGINYEWDGSAGNWPIESYDVRYRRAAWNGGFGAYAIWKGATTDEFGTLTAKLGSTYCLSVRANDSNGGHSAWTKEACTAVPLDDRSLTRSRGWTAGSGTAYFRSTYLRATAAGSTLTRTGVVAKQIALLVTTCSTCGSVKVYWGSTLLKTISLVSKTTVNRKLITVATFSSARTGTLVIKVASSGKRVMIDGVGIKRN